MFCSDKYSASYARERQGNTCSLVLSDFNQNWNLSTFVSKIRDSFIVGHAVALLGAELCYKPEGRWFDSQLGHCIFQMS
jgi:hypothetical protein